MRDETVMTVVGGGNGYRDQLALELGKPRRREHEIVRHRDEGLEFREIKFVRLENVRHEAELLPAFREIGLHRVVELRGRQIEGDRFFGRGAGCNFLVLFHGLPSVPTDRDGE